MLGRNDRIYRQRGISMILIVILLVITIVFCAAALLLYANMLEKEQIQQALREERDRIDQEIADLIQKIPPVARPTGVSPEGEELQINKSREIYKKKKDDIVVPVIQKDLDKINEAVKEGKISQAPAVDSVEKLVDQAKIFSTLQEIVPVLAQELEEKKLIHGTLEMDSELWKERAAAAEALGQVYGTGRIEQRDKLRDEIAKVNALISKENAEYQRQKSEFTTKHDEATAAIEQQQEEYHRFETRIKNELTVLRDRLEELKVKEVIKHHITMSWGKVLEPDIPQKMAFIDMGSRERIKPGMKFLVARWGKQGGFDYKGEVEVKKVWMTYSEVSITDVFHPEVPMVDGDMLVNPLFNPRRSVIVCFAGEQRMNQLKFPTVVEAANRIREMGGTVRDSVTLDVDYVIFTEDSKSPGRREDKYPNYGKAVLLEVPVAEASEIFRFLGD